MRLDGARSTRQRQQKRAEAEGRPRIEADDVGAAVAKAAIPSLVREMGALQQQLNALQRNRRL